MHRTNLSARLLLDVELLRVVQHKIHVLIETLMTRNIRFKCGTRAAQTMMTPSSRMVVFSYNMI